jgi:hypothetical protein
METLPTPRALSYTFETDLLEHAQQSLTTLTLQPYFNKAPSYIGMKFLHDPTT